LERALAQTAKVGMLLDEASIPIDEEVKGACEILGLDPLYVANEGKLLAIVAAEDVSSICFRANSCREFAEP
jgi:hydrogenase expression/formation protein HypE